MIVKIRISICVIVFFASCSSNDNSSTSSDSPDPSLNTISSLEYIDEIIITNDPIDHVPTGGFSGIDYKNDTWYIISDGSNPIRYYIAHIAFNQEGFSNASIGSLIEIKDEIGTSIPENEINPEAIRFDIDTGNIIYTSEGSISNNVDPALLEIEPNGTQLRSFVLPENLNANTTNDQSGPRHNGTLESLCISFDSNAYWIGMELPLIEDGPEPTTTETESPVRITRINKTNGTPERQFVYELDAVDREPALGTTFSINGLVEILEYDENQFLFLERSFSSGYLDGGNTIKIYNVDATNASNTLNTSSISSETVIKAAKTLLFEFNSIRSELTNNTVDNIEGITFGPLFSDGSKSLIVISDNNFNAFLPQLNQVILFKIIP